MDDILSISEQNQQRAWKVVNDSDIINIWQSVGAEINLIGSLKTGLLMKHRDIDFHIYTPSLNISDSFQAMAKLAENPRIKNITYTNLLDTEEACIEWHAWYLDVEDQLWQIDMIHILKGSKYEGYFENVADKIINVLTPDIKRTILSLKYDTPDDEKIMGIEYYVAVIRHGITNYSDFAAWRKKNPATSIIEWLP